MSRSKTTRPMISIFMLFGFLTILITGLLSYGLRYNSLLSAIHTVFGLSFILFGIFHLKNNVRPLINYLKPKSGKRFAGISVVLILVSTIGLALKLPPFQTIVDTGYALKELRPIDRQMTETLYTHIDRDGKKIAVDVKAGAHYSGPGAVVLGVTTTAIPQMAIWLEDIDGNYLDTLYITKKASNSSYIQSLFASEDVRRPEALPHWAFSRGIQSEDGLMVPSSAQPIADSVTGATPVASFDLQSVVNQKYQQVVVKLEINRSFDYNDAYHKNAFPKDEVYSGSGNSAQPSLIYAASINLNKSERYYFMSLKGRGHHSGKDGQLYTDIDGVTTAKEMLNRIIIEVI